MKIFIVLALSFATWRHEIRRYATIKPNHLASGVCWCSVLLEGVKVRLSHKCVTVIIWDLSVATMIKLQQFVISEPDEVYYRGRAAIQQLSALAASRQASLHSRHIMTSALHLD